MHLGMPFNTGKFTKTLNLLYFYMLSFNFNLQILEMNFHMFNLVLLLQVLCKRCSAATFWVFVVHSLTKVTTYLLKSCLLCKLVEVLGLGDPSLENRANARDFQLFRH